MSCMFYTCLNKSYTLPTISETLSDKQTYSENTRVFHSTRCDQPSRFVEADIPAAGLVTAEVNG